MKPIAELRRTTRAALCLDCGKCTSSCPLAALGDFSARLIARQSYGVPGENGDAVQRCLSCAACEVRCPEEVQVTDFVLGLRRMTPEEKRRPCPHSGIFQSVARSMAGPEPPRRDMSWIGPDLRVAEEGKVGLFVGCLPFFDAYFQDELGTRTIEIARSAIRVLNRMGIEPVVLSDERCCGHDLLWDGEREPFEALAAANAEAFAARGVKELVTTCAECCRTWRSDYAEAVPHYKPRVRHMAELLAQQVEAGELSFREDGGATLTYQDPCRLGRHLGVTEAPRTVLAAMPGTETVEMERSGRDAICCGTSGFIHCDADSRKLQASRLQTAAATGADVLVTACPKCLIHFSCTQAEDLRRGRGSTPIEVKDLSVLAASLLEDGAGATQPAREPAGETVEVAS